MTSRKITMADALNKGNILRTKWPQSEKDYIPVYLGSGKAGACFDAWGLMNRPWQSSQSGSLPNTAYLHADHWHRGLYGLDMLLPLYQLVWTETPTAPVQYRQELHLLENRLETQLEWAHLRIHMNLSFHPDKRNLLVLDFQFEASPDQPVPGIGLKPITDLMTQGYKQHVSGIATSVPSAAETGCHVTQLRIGKASTTLAFQALDRKGRCSTLTTAAGTEVHFSGTSGRHLLVIGACGSSEQETLMQQMSQIKDVTSLFTEMKEAWRKRYGDACVLLSDDRHQALWSRSLHYLLCSFSPEPVCPVSPMGFSGNGWPFHFPQDMAYILPAFLQLGHFDIAKGIVSYYRSCLSNMQAFTKRIYGVGGAQWAWEFPMDNKSNLLDSGYPNPFQFEIHNAAYPAFMASETAQAIQEEDWTRDVAWPIIRESARFFTEVLKKDDDGTWGMEVIPSMGQDEWGGENAKNYLCALISARYCLTTALKTAEQLGSLPEEQLGTTPDETNRWHAILRDGLSFPRLLHPRYGLHMTCEGNPDDFHFGVQKHPIQLSPLTFLPIGAPGDPERKAYDMRYDLCKGSHEHFFTGWSLATFWLAAARLRDGTGFERDLEEAVPSFYVDPSWSVLFETSRQINMPMYLTNHGLFMQAVHEALLHGDTTAPASAEVRPISSGLPSTWLPAKYWNLRSRDGQSFSGSYVMRC